MPPPLAFNRNVYLGKTLSNGPWKKGKNSGGLADAFFAVAHPLRRRLGPRDTSGKGKGKKTAAGGDDKIQKPSLPGHDAMTGAASGGGGKGFCLKAGSRKRVLKRRKSGSTNTRLARGGEGSWKATRFVAGDLRAGGGENTGEPRGKRNLQNRENWNGARTRER